MFSRRIFLNESKAEYSWVVRDTFLQWITHTTNNVVFQLLHTLYLRVGNCTIIIVLITFVPCRRTHFKL